jgi:type VI secretion system secreted protein Hcp
MKIDGVSGDSKSFKNKGWADVLSWNWGMTSNRKLANGIDGDNTSLNELSIIKSIGIDSASIRLLYAQGKTIPSVELSITPILGKREVQTKYVNVKMEDVLIKSIVTGGNTEDTFFKEHITLLFDRVRFEYSLDALSSDAGSEDIDFGWNVPGNVEWEH